MIIAANGSMAFLIIPIHINDATISNKTTACTTEYINPFESENPR